MCAEIVITDHLKMRLIERVGIPKRAHRRFVNDCIKYGVTLDQVKDNPKLYDFLLVNTKRGGNTCTVYQYKTYALIVDFLTNTGITILDVPTPCLSRGERRNNDNRKCKENKRHAGAVQTEDVSARFRNKRLQEKRRRIVSSRRGKPRFVD